MDIKKIPTLIAAGLIFICIYRPSSAQTANNFTTNRPPYFESDEFAIYKLKYLQGTLTSESDILRLAKYYEDSGAPFQAAKLIETVMDGGGVNKTAIKLVWLSKLFESAREDDRALAALLEASRYSEHSLDSGEWNALLDGTFEDKIMMLGGCENTEPILITAMNNGFDRGDG